MLLLNAINVLLQDTITPLAGSSENMLASLGLSPPPPASKMAKKEGSDDSIGEIRGQCIGGSEDLCVRGSEEQGIRGSMCQGIRGAGDQGIRG